MPFKIDEDTLQRYVKDLMDSPRADKRVVWFHVPNEGLNHVRHNVNMKLRGVLPGVSDCVFLIPQECAEWPLCLFLELKNGKKGRHSDAQKEFQQRVEAIRGDYRLAKTVEEINAVLVEFGVIRDVRQTGTENSARKRTLPLAALGTYGGGASAASSAKRNTTDAICDRPRISGETTREESPVQCRAQEKTRTRSDTKDYYCDNRICAS